MYSDTFRKDISGRIEEKWQTNRIPRVVISLPIESK